MMYDELVKKLRAECTLPFATLQTMRDAADAIEDMEFACNRYEKDYKALCAYLPKWIPVTERLPEKRHCVLIFTKKGGTAEGEYDGDGWTQYRWSAKMGVDVVTHWQPLPEPPKEETE